MGEHKGERWAAVQPIVMQLWDDEQMRPAALLHVQKLIELQAETEGVDLDHETWQIIEPAKFNGDYLQIETDDGYKIPVCMILRVEGVGR